MKVIFYAIDGLGIGHLTRLLAIARKLKALVCDAEILFLTSSEADHLIFREGFPAIKFPSKTIRSQVGLRKRTFLETCMPVTWNVISSFRPDVIVVDTYPQGSMQELIPVLHWAPKMVFVFRQQRPERVTEAEFQKLLSYYDHVIVPHTAEEFNPPLPNVPTTFTGPILIRERKELLARGAVRTLLEIPRDKKTVYCTFGGGGDATSREAFRLVRQVITARSDCFLITAQGPLGRGLSAVQPGGAQLFYYPAIELFAAFDVAISGAGYNSVNELLYAGVPSIFVPFERDLDDQALRADRVAGAGAGIKLDRLSPEALNYAFEKLISEAHVISEKARAQVSSNGAERAAEVIAEVAGVAVAPPHDRVVQET